MTDDGRLDSETARAVLPSAAPIAVRAASSIAKRTVRGRGVDGEVITLDMNQAWWLLLFVSEGCLGCVDLVEHLRAGGRFGLENHAVALMLREGDRTTVPGVTSVISDEMWSAYGVTGPPFFSLISANASTVVTEGVAWGVEAVTQSLSAATHGHPAVDVLRLEATDEA